MRSPPCLQIRYWALASRIEESKKELEDFRIVCLRVVRDVEMLFKYAWLLDRLVNRSLGKGGGMRLYLRLVMPLFTVVMQSPR